MAVVKDVVVCMYAVYASVVIKTHIKLYVKLVLKQVVDVPALSKPPDHNKKEIAISKYQITLVYSRRQCRAVTLCVGGCVTPGSLLVGLQAEPVVVSCLVVLHILSGTTNNKHEILS